MEWKFYQPRQLLVRERVLPRPFDFARRSFFTPREGGYAEADAIYDVIYIVRRV